MAKTADAGKTKAPLSRRILRAKYLYLMMLPAAVWYVCFHILPLYGIVAAFQDFKLTKGFFGSEWVGLENFRVLFASDFFWNALRNTLLISTLKLAIGFPMPILLALAITNVQNKIFRRVTQTISYLPHFMSWVIVFAMSELLFDEYIGAVGGILRSIGIGYTANVSAQTDTIIPFLLISSMWKTVGRSSIVYLAALSGVDPELYEAAKIDGAGRARMCFAITLPTIAPICAIVLILAVGHILGEDFEQIYMFQRNNPALIEKTQVFETYVFRQITSIVSKDSLPTALGLFQSVVGAILILITNSISKKLGYGGLY
ncbi:MAG: ABC transporter permease subunit [Clostridiales bacterium]|jgi:putative aldouronate transport system permease protein|nr:ABC transporter permease subunit [Clostridiales bacterium]